MGWKGAGLRLLRWVVWLFFLLIFVRGIFTFVPTAAMSQPDPVQQPAQVSEPPGLRSFPALFAREYLTWQPGRSDERSSRLEPYLASGMDRQAGWSPGRDSIGQAVEGVWVHGVSARGEGLWLVTVVARVTPYQESLVPEGAGWRTDRKELAGSVLYLAVPIASAGTGWAVYDYPTLVPPPPRAEVSAAARTGTEVADAGDRIKTLASGFFKAYLSGAGDVSYFLAPGASLPPLRTTMELHSIGKVTLVQTASGHEALTDLLVVDPATGARFTYRYTLKVTERDGRWYVQDLFQRGE